MRTQGDMYKSIQSYPWSEKDDIWIFGDASIWETFNLLYYDVYIRGYITDSPNLADYYWKEKRTIKCRKTE